jgi:hypothetical protein
MENRFLGVSNDGWRMEHSRSSKQLDRPRESVEITIVSDLILSLPPVAT